MLSGNGIDLAAIYQLLTEVAEKVAAHDRRFEQIDRKIDDIAAGLTELRLSVNQYHGAVIGHGIELTELGARVRRIEAQITLGPQTPQPRGGRRRAR